jgi:hypothetical protein
MGEALIISAVWRETLERWQDWQVCAQVWQSFCTPDHTKHWATSFAVALVAGCDCWMVGEALIISAVWRETLERWQDWQVCAQV